MTASAPPLRPTSASERIDVIDILRGLALFGILAANMRGFSAPAQVYFNVEALFKSRIDSVVQDWVYLLIQGKFVTLFSFLFGLGFAVQMDRAAERGKSVAFYPRRLAVLLIFGLIHSWFIWWGDILVGYALTGFVLFFFRRASQRVIAIVAIVLFLIPPAEEMWTMVWGILHPVTHSGGGGAGGEALQQSIQQAISIYRDGSFWARVHQRFWDWLSFTGHLPALIATLTLPRFLVGLWVWRAGVFKNLPEFIPAIRRIWIAALAAGLFMEGTAMAIAHATDAGYKLHPAFGRVASMLYQQSSPVIALFYGCSVLLVCQSVRWKERLRPFGAVGRMALTNYILQSLVCTYFFRWTKLFGAAGPAFDLIPTFVLYALQIPFSAWWLQHFQFGPLEWLWRALTYGTAPAMRRSAVDSDSPLHAGA